MNSFVQHHASKITGMLNGWDRIRFRGTLRMLAHVTGLDRFLGYTGRLLKDFREYAPALSRQTRDASLAVAEQAGRPVVHLNSPNVCKEDLASTIAERDRIKAGLICTLTAVEPCYSFNIRSNKEAGRLELVRDYRKCQHIYHYYLHPVFGFMHVRLQTWLPFNQFVCLNGREWLARQMDAAGIGYMRKENCFIRVSDVAAAQKLLDQQVSHDWQAALGQLGMWANPAYRSILGDYEVDYYWSLEESEWASDIMFNSERELSELYPSLIRHGMEHLGSRDVLRFLGRKVPVQGGVPGRLAAEVVSDLKRRPEGIRIKHRVGVNSVKMYNKQGSVLRVETTLNNVRDFKSARTINGKVVWQKMRKGVSDIGRRAEVSQASNQRYLEALAAVTTPLPLKELTGSLAKAVVREGRRARALNLLGEEDARLLEVIGDGKFLINGLRNRDLQEALYAQATDDPAEKRRRSGRMSRKLWLLRAHGLIRKVPCTHRYLVTEKGRQVVTAIMAARQADVTKLSLAA